MGPEGLSLYISIEQEGPHGAGVGPGRPDPPLATAQYLPPLHDVETGIEFGSESPPPVLLNLGREALASRSLASARPELSVLQRYFSFLHGGFLRNDSYKCPTFRNKTMF